ncbi:hypothetical protein J4E91_002602 [Alternaria rosae]|nr:hypothetical protein J4E91_002602 [Alternaria rosae]
MIPQKPCLQIRERVVHNFTADVILRSKICHGELNKALVTDDEAGSYRLRQIKGLKTPPFSDRAYFKQSYCGFTDLFPHLEVLYVDLWNARYSSERNGWSADQIEQDLQQRTKVLLQRERSGLNIVITEYTNLVLAGTSILQEV